MNCIAAITSGSTRFFRAKSPWKFQKKLIGIRITTIPVSDDHAACCVDNQESVRPFSLLFFVVSWFTKKTPLAQNTNERHQTTGSGKLFTLNFHQDVCATSVEWISDLYLHCFCEWSQSAVKPVSRQRQRKVQAAVNLFSGLPEFERNVPTCFPQSGCILILCQRG